MIRGRILTPYSMKAERNQRRLLPPCSMRRRHQAIHSRMIYSDATRRKEGAMRRRIVEQALLEAEILATVDEIEREGVAAYVKRHQVSRGKR